MAESLLYGGFELRLRDFDSPDPAIAPTYGGSPRPNNHSTHVLQLQKDLQTLRFFRMTPTGTFDIRTEWAVREFQTYAGLSKTAKEDPLGAEKYWDNYTTVNLSGDGHLDPNGINGVVTQDTAKAINKWVTENWRCPVLVNAYPVNGHGDLVEPALATNLWAHDDYTNSSPRMFVKDWTGRSGASSDWQPLGDYATYLSYAGPRSVPGTHTLPSGEIKQSSVGLPAQPSPAQLSTFKVLYAGSYPEIGGQFDAVNAYDNAFLSIGPCQWTISPKEAAGKHDKGELPAFLAYLQDYDPGTRALCAPGIDVLRVDTPDRTTWQESNSVLLPGEHLFNGSQVKYETFLGITAYRPPLGAVDSIKLLKLDKLKSDSNTPPYDELDFFRSWHSFYRMVFAARSSDTFRTAMWTMARTRLRDILKAPFPAGALPYIDDQDGGVRQPTIGEVFQSERSAAFLLRWHIKKPASVISAGQATSKVVEAWRAANLTASDPGSYTDADEATLLARLREEIISDVGGGIESQLDRIEAISVPQLGTLNVTHGGLSFDGSGLVSPPTRYPQTDAGLSWQNREQWINTLHGDLLGTGFYSGLTADLSRLKIAVREFKNAARWQKVAIARHVPPPNPSESKPSAFDSAPNPPSARNNQWGSGDVLTVEVIKALVRWRRSGWRYGLVVTERKINSGAPGDVVSNFLWNRSEIAGDSLADRVFGRDAVRTFSLNYPNNNDLLGTGRPQTFDPSPSRSSTTFPTSVSVQEAAGYWNRNPVEILPEMTGSSWSSLSPEGKTTFRVLRAVAQLETDGFLDIVKADELGRLAFLLAGLPFPTPRPPNRLGAFAAYLKSTDATTFSATFGVFGVEPAKAWGTNGSALFQGGLRIYGGDISWRDDSQVISIDYLCGWAWYSRLVYFARAYPEKFGSAIWGFARTQLRELLRTEISLDDQGTPYSDPNDHHHYTIGEVFTSELAVALIFAWSLRQPSEVVNTGGMVTTSHAGLGKVLADARASLPLATTPPSQWNGTHEAALITKLKARLNLTTNKPNVRSIAGLGGWPPPTGQNDPYTLPGGAGNPRTDLEETRNNSAGDRFFFPLDTTGLPPFPSPPVPLAPPVPHQFGSIVKAIKSAVTLSKNLIHLEGALADQPLLLHAFTATPRGAVRLSSARNAGGDILFGAYLVGSSEPTGTAPFVAESVVLTYTTDDPAREDGFEVPLTSSFNFTVARADSPNGAIGVTMPGGIDGGLLPAVDLADGITIAQKIELTLDFTEVLPAQSCVQEAKIILQDLARAAGSTTGRVFLEVTLGGEGVSGNPTWRFPAAVDSQTVGTFKPFRMGSDAVSLQAEIDGDAFSYGVPVSGQVAGHLTLRQTDEFLLDATFQEVATQGITRLDLGSPLARFGIPATSSIDWSLADGFALTLPEGECGEILLDVFDKIPDANALLGHAWEAARNEEGWLMKFGGATTALPEDLRRIEWNLDGPSISTDLVMAAFNTSALPSIATDRNLIDLSPAGIGDATKLFTTNFDSSSSSFWIDFQDLSLNVPLKLILSPSANSELIRAEGVFRFRFSNLADGRFTFKPGALRMEGTLELTTVADKVFTFAELFTLKIPKGRLFRFEAGVGNVKTSLVKAQVTEDGPPPSITLAFPAHPAPGVDQFVFELSEFAAHTGGIDFRGAVRPGNVSLGDSQTTGIDGALDVHPATFDSSGAPTFGEVVCEGSKITSWSLRAAAKLPFFDDATGTFTLQVSEGRQGFDAAGVFEVSGLPQFHVRSLYLTCEIPHLVFNTRFSKSGNWSSDIRMTGTITCEPPDDASASEMAELEDLFDQHLSVSFENLDLTKLNVSTLTFNCSPQSFRLFDLVRIDVSGLRIGKEGTGDDEDFVLGLLGEATLERLPLINAQLTFGGITLRHRVHTRKFDPRIEIKKFGFSLSPPAGFKASGSLEPEKPGFRAMLELETDFLPRTRIVGGAHPITAGNGETVPGFFLAAQTSVTAPLYAGFYLRSLGFGFGINNTLSGLEPKPGKTGIDRIIEMVKQPNGLPDPLIPEAWVADAPANSGSVNWTFAGVGGITYGNLAEDEEHPFVGRIIIALDGRLEIFIGAKMWLYSAPTKVLDADYQAHPVAQGGLLVLAHEPRISGYAETLPNPRMGDSVPDIVRQAISSVRAQLSVDATPSTFELKVGWPKELQYSYDLGSFFHGQVNAGFRFGMAGQAVTFGLNVSAMINVELGGELGFDTSEGSASASVNATFSANADLTVRGALKRVGWRMVPYLVGNVTAKAGLDVSASADCRLGPKWSPLKISFSGGGHVASVDLDCSAAFFEGTGPEAMGLRGSAQVSVTVCGWDLGGSIGFRFRDELIEKSQQQIDALTPAAAGSQFGQLSRFASFAAPIRTALNSPVWHYRFHVPPVPATTDDLIVRVLLFPAVGNIYSPPAVAPAVDAPFRFSLPLTELGAGESEAGYGWQGFLAAGTGTISSRLLEWDEEDLDETFATGINDGLEVAVTLRNLLQALPVIPEPLLPESADEEITDDWIKRPDVTDANDGTAGIRPPDLFPLRRRAKAHSNYDQFRYLSCRSVRPSRTEFQRPSGLPLSWLFNDLVGLLCSADSEMALQEKYRLASRLRLVLLFKIKKSDFPDWNKPSFDPVPSLIDLSASRTLAGTAANLSSARPADTEYLLTPGRFPFVSQDGIGLVWEFKQLRKNSQGALEPVASISERYMECHCIKVRRYRNGALDREFIAPPGAWFTLKDSAGDRIGPVARMPHQFIDKDVATFRELEWIRYEIIAQSPDRELQKTNIEVQWRTLKPLPSVKQVQVIHRLAAAAPDGTYRDGTFEFAVAFRDPPSADVNLADCLQVRYQIIDAPRAGHYGFGTRRPGIPLPNSSGVSDPDPFFSDASDDEAPTLWEQIPKELRLNPPGQPGLTWTEISMDGATIGMRATVDESDIRNILAAAGTNKAVEFFIGLHRPPVSDEPLTRSPLQVCRHAILLPTPAPTPSGSPQDIEKEYFSRGNVVEAIELPFISSRRSSPTDWVLGNLFESPPFRLATDTVVGEETYDDRLALQWQHIESDDDDEMPPVTGYRIFRTEATSPGEYRRLSLNRVFGPAAVDVANDLISIAGHGFSDGQRVVYTSSGTPIGGLLRGSEYFVKNSTTDTLRLSRSSGDAPIDLVGTGSGQHSLSQDGFDIRPTCELNIDVWPAPIYKSFPRHIQVRILSAGLTYRPLSLHPPKRLWASPSSPRSSTPFMPSMNRNASDQRYWLHPDLVRVAEVIAETLGKIGFTNAWFELTATEPLWDCGTATFDPESDLLARFQRAKARLPSIEDDPFGWSAAESIGLACECVWRDESGTAIDPALFDDSSFGAQLGSLLDGADVALFRFIADDGTSPLFTTRLVYVGDEDSWKTWGDDANGNVPYHQFENSLGLKLLGRVNLCDPSGIPAFPPGERAERVGFYRNSLLRVAVTEWLTGAADSLFHRCFEVPAKLLTDLGFGGYAAGQLIDLVSYVVPDVREKRLRRSRDIVALRRGGLVVADLPIANRLRHEYLVAVQLVRRYDEMLRALRIAGNPTAPVDEVTIPSKALCSAVVPRNADLLGNTAALVNSVPGGIQAQIFMHPAEFAATSSIVNQAHFDFTGQHVALMRRLPGGRDGRLKIEAAFQQFRLDEGLASASDVDWAMYLGWVTTNGTERPGAGPKIPVPLSAAGDKLDLLPSAIQPVAKAFKYTYPALPECYEYGVVVDCTAGNSRSPTTTSSFVRPQFIKPSQWPVASAVVDTSISLDLQARTLTLRVPLPHPRQYLDPDLRPLWVNSDIPVLVNQTTRLKYGSLPDLFSRIIVFVWSRQADYQSGSLKVLLPLIEVFSPLSPANPAPNDLKFVGRCPLLLHSSTVDCTLTQATGANNGRLELLLKLQLNSTGIDSVDAQNDEIIGRLKQLQEAVSASEWFHVCVERSGALSDPQPSL